MPRSSSLPLINAQSRPVSAARSQIVRSEMGVLDRCPVAFETGPFRLGIAAWAPIWRPKESATRPIGGRRPLRLHAV
jgi:hypothetical protein